GRDVVVPGCHAAERGAVRGSGVEPARTGDAHVCVDPDRQADDVHLEGAGLGRIEEDVLHRDDHDAACGYVGGGTRDDRAILVAAVRDGSGAHDVETRVEVVQRGAGGERLHEAGAGDGDVGVDTGGKAGDVDDQRAGIGWRWGRRRRR